MRETKPLFWPMKLNNFFGQRSPCLFVCLLLVLFQNSKLPFEFFTSLAGGGQDGVASNTHRCLPLNSKNKIQIKMLWLRQILNKACRIALWRLRSGFHRTLICRWFWIIHTRINQDPPVAAWKADWDCFQQRAILTPSRWLKRMVYWASKKGSMLVDGSLALENTQPHQSKLLKTWCTPPCMSRSSNLPCGQLNGFFLPWTLDWRYFERLFVFLWKIWAL